MHRRSYTTESLFLTVKVQTEVDSRTEVSSCLTLSHSSSAVPRTLAVLVRAAVPHHLPSLAVGTQRAAVHHRARGGGAWRGGGGGDLCGGGAGGLFITATKNVCCTLLTVHVLTHPECSTEVFSVIALGQIPLPGTRALAVEVGTAVASTLTGLVISTEDSAVH